MEIGSLINNDTWSITRLPEGQHSIGSILALRNKYFADGSVEGLKAPLVAQGFSQRPGIDFIETYAPVAKFSSVRILLPIAAKLKLEVRQLDIATTYLNGAMDERVFIRPPPLLEEHLKTIVKQRGENDKIAKKAIKIIAKIEKCNGEFVCKLNKAIYGLKQAGRQWHKRFDKTLKAIGLNPISSDPCIYTGNVKWKSESSLRSYTKIFQRNNKTCHIGSSLIMIIKGLGAWLCVTCLVLEQNT